MNGSASPASSGLALGTATNLDAEAAVLTFSEVQKLAAERRANAEALLAQARAFEEQLESERTTMSGSIAAAEAAQVAETEAQTQLAAAREKHTALVAAEEEARAEVDARMKALNERRDARAGAETAMTELLSRVEQLSNTNGLNVEAVKRIIERRQADRLRQGAKNAVR